MKIHTSLNYHEMYALVRDSDAPINYHKLDTLGSRTHANGFDVRLTGTGGRNNTGMYGAGDYNGATWDEWGAFFGALFRKDPDARCGGTLVNPVYRNASHFHYLTANRFQLSRGMHLPADTHPRHRWEYDTPILTGPQALHCAKADCSAKRPPFIAGKDWS